MAGTSGPPMAGTPGDAMDGGLPTTEVDASAQDSDAGATYESRELVGPSYMGSVSNSVECSMSYPTQGHEPLSAASAKHPLFLYFVGTEFVAGDPSAQHSSPAALAVTEAMARRGFVALSVRVLPHE
jgi:hypothetical protein